MSSDGKKTDIYAATKLLTTKRILPQPELTKTLRSNTTLHDNQNI